MRGINAKKQEQNHVSRLIKLIRWEFAEDIFGLHFAEERPWQPRTISEYLQDSYPKANVTLGKVEGLINMDLSCPKVRKEWTKKLKRALKKHRQPEPTSPVCQPQFNLEWSLSDRKWFKDEGVDLEPPRNLKEERKALIAAVEPQKFYPQEFICPKCGVKTMVEHKDIWDEYQEAGVCIRCEVDSKKDGDPPIAPSFAEQVIMSTTSPKVIPMVKSSHQNNLLKGLIPVDGDIMNQVYAMKGAKSQVPRTPNIRFRNGPRTLSIVTNMGERMKSKRVAPKETKYRYTSLCIGEFWLETMGWNRTQVIVNEHDITDKISIAGTKVKMFHYWETNQLFLIKDELEGRTISFFNLSSKHGAVKIPWVPGMTQFKRCNLFSSARKVMLAPDTPALCIQLPDNAYVSKPPPRELWATPPEIIGDYAI